MKNKNVVYKQLRVRKFLRKQYGMTDNELTTYLILKHHLDHYPTRQEIIQLENLIIYERN